MVGWLITLGILVLFALIPLGGCVIYNENGLIARVIAGPIRITIFPKRKKKASTDDSHSDGKENKSVKTKKSVEQKPNKKNTSKKKSESKNGGSFLDFIPLVKLALRFLGDFRRKIRVDRLEMNLMMAGGDPCDLAVNYGRSWTALGNLVPLLERAFVIKKRDLNVSCDFLAEKTLIYARLDITITLGRLLSLAVNYGIRALCEFIKLMNKRKGGAKV